MDTSQYTPGKDNCGLHWHEIFFLFMGRVDDSDVERSLLFKCCISLEKNGELIDLHPLRVSHIRTPEVHVMTKSK